MIARTVRLLDTGVRSAADNMALDAVLLDAVAEDRSPPTLRFLRFSPPAALVGAFQHVEDEVRVDFCREHGIDINRRMTGGGAVFFDESQLGWEIIGRRQDLGLPSPSAALFERLCDPVLAALKGLGIEARYRPRNDIEVRGRKISGTGGTEKGDAILFQGTLLVDFDADTMVRALRVPVEKLKRKEIESLKDRVTWIRREIGCTPPFEDLRRRLARAFEERLGMTLRSSGLLPEEETALRERQVQFASPAWIHGERPRRSHVYRSILPTEHGTLKVSLKASEPGDRIDSLFIEGDFFAFPEQAIYDLEAGLKGVSKRSLGTEIERIFRDRRADLAGLSPRDLHEAIAGALERKTWRNLGIGQAQANAIFTIQGSLDDVARLGPTHLLLPYCSKPVSCEQRNLDACDRCGECKVGDAYRMAEENGLEAISITGFEHLMDTLQDIRGRGGPAFIGSCCEAFYIKHRAEMEAVGLPGLLFDIRGAETCYDLGKASFAYRGEFEGETEVDIALLDTILRAIGRIGSLYKAAPGEGAPKAWRGTSPQAGREPKR